MRRRRGILIENVAQGVQAPEERHEPAHLRRKMPLLRSLPAFLLHIYNDAAPTALNSGTPSEMRGLSPVPTRHFFVFPIPPPIH